MGCAYLNKAEHALATAIEAGTCMPVSMGGVERLGAREVEVFRMNADEPALDWVAEEVPVALVYNGISHAVMMASPSMLEEFALGFSLAEGIIPDASHLYACEVREACRGGIEVDLTISSECFWKLKDRRRSMTGRTGCGICGVESLGEAVREKRVVPHEQTFPMAAYADALGDLERVERLGGITGAAVALIGIVYALIVGAGEDICYLYIMLAGGVLPMMLSTLLRIAQFETTISIPELLNGNSTLVRITHDGIVGRVRAFLPFVVAFGSDAGAYFCGRAFGKKQLAPAISPHKTVAGGIGGAVCGAAMALLYGVIVRACGLSANLVSLAAFGLVGSVVAQLGDLTFSAFKRQYGIKDYGNILPGHGGMLDRFDSMYYLAPLTELWMLLLPAISA